MRQKKLWKRVREKRLQKLRNRIKRRVQIGDYLWTQRGDGSWGMAYSPAKDDERRTEK